MPKKKQPELTPEEQAKRFKEAAKKAGLTKDEEQFSKRFDALDLSAPQQRKPKKSK